MNKVSETIKAILEADPHMSNADVAAEVQKRIPGSTTSAASVSSMKSGMRRRGELPEAVDNAVAAVPDFEKDDETDKERFARIDGRYKSLERMADKVVEGLLPAVIVSGPPGLGKSFTVETRLAKAGYELTEVTVLQNNESDNADSTTELAQFIGEKKFDSITGAITAPALFISLWNLRNGGILVLDDCDDVFRDETCLNLLKAVLDSSDVRRVSYRKMAQWMQDLNIPASFVFKGKVIFCTNFDFELMIKKGSNMAPHFSALMDRCLYLSLTMRSHKDYLCRIRTVAIDERMLEKAGLTKKEAEETMKWVEKHADRFYSLSIRLLHQIALCRLADPKNWKQDVEATKMRTF